MPRTPCRFALTLLLSISLAHAAPAPDWVARSNQLADPVLQDKGKYQPEAASADGREEFDSQVIDLGPRRHERQLADLEARRDALKTLLAAESDPKVRQDLEILVMSREQAIETERLEHRYMLGYVDAVQIVYFGLKTLLDPRNKPQRQARALVRLKRYAGLETGYAPIAALARARTEEELARGALIGPYVEELKQQLENTDYYLKGLALLFTKAQLPGWEPDLAVLGRQLRDYDVWLREAVLPRARAEVRLPPAMYANRLKLVGVDIGPEELIERAAFDFQDVRDEMQILAGQIAARRRLPAADYRDVIRDLKRQQLAPGIMLKTYRERMQEIEAIIRREKLVTVPERKPVVRAATEAEAAAIPAPFMNPPRLIGNTGEYGEFVIPLSNPHAKTKARMDDFSNDAAAWTLAAHEARPGHELQFSSMVERGVSIPRAIFAFNSANVEGWGLYSEAMMLPYMPAEGQLMSLQLRLLRLARAFLDPLVNLGRITPAEAKRFLMEEVVASEPFAQQEVDRYAFNAPGQATAYYYGYVQLRALRTQVELALGRNFDLMAFNDFVLAQGLLPPRLLRQAMLDEFIPARLAAASKTGAK